MIIAELMVLSGNVGAPDFLDWISHRARRLGLKGWVKAASCNRLEMLVIGPPDLVDAMELGCSLGPMSVMVDHVDRTSHDTFHIPNGFSVLETGT